MRTREESAAMRAKLMEHLEAALALADVEASEFGRAAEADVSKNKYIGTLSSDLSLS